MTIRVAAIEVSHWHALNDAAYLRHLIAMPDVELIAIQDSDADLVARRAAEVGSPPTFTDYRALSKSSAKGSIIVLLIWKGRRLKHDHHTPTPTARAHQPTIQARQWKVRSTRPHQRFLGKLPSGDARPFRGWQSTVF
jgi:hypothetical protein